MRLRNSKTTGQERPQTPPTPGTPHSEDSVAPWVKDEVSTEKGPRFLEDIVADEVTYPLCRILWQFVLSPLWWMLRPTIWGYLLHPILWERVIRQGLWEGISRQILWEGVMQHILFKTILQDVLGEKMFLPLYQICQVVLFPRLQTIWETMLFPLYRQLVETLPASARRKIKSALSPVYRYLEKTSGPVRTIIWDSILRPVLSRVRPEELLSLLFVLNISVRITFSSSNAYIFARGYRPDTDEFSERSETEFGQIPFQDKYTWCWLLQWIAWFMWGR